MISEETEVVIIKDKNITSNYVHSENEFHGKDVLLDRIEQEYLF